MTSTIIFRQIVCLQRFYFFDKSFYIFILLCYLYEFFASNQRLYRDAENNTHTVHCTCCSSERRAIRRTCSRLIVWRRGMAKSICEYNMVWFWQTVLRKSTHIYDKMYNFMTMKKKKTFSVGRLFTVSRTWTIKQLFFFLAQVTNRSPPFWYVMQTCS